MTPDRAPAKELGSEKRLRFYCELWPSVNIRMGGKSSRHSVESRGRQAQ